jgi:predicted Zn-dependent protease
MAFLLGLEPYLSLRDVRGNAGGRNRAAAPEVSVANEGAEGEPMSCTCHLLSRRHLLVTGAAAAILPLGACDENGPALTLVSQDEVEALGLRSWSRLRETTPLSQSAEAQRIARRVTDRLVRAEGGDPAAWEVRVFRGGQINAFALPGRKIGIYEGMMRLAETQDQLAAVIGHEIGHLAADHGTERINSQVATDLGLRTVEALLTAGDVGAAEDIAAALGLGVEYGLARPYSRRQELEADAYGLRAMDRAGYDPAAAIRLWERMKAAGRTTPELLSTHPAPETRIAEMRGIIDRLG